MFLIVPMLAMLAASPSPTPSPPPVILTGCKTDTDSRKSGILGSLVATILGRSSQPIAQDASGEVSTFAAQSSVRTRTVIGLQSASPTTVKSIRLLVLNGTAVQDVKTPLLSHGFLSVPIAGECPATIIMVERADGTFWFPPPSE